MDRVERQRARLRQLIKESGGTHETLAARVGTAPSYISQLMTARGGISRKFCVRLETAMNKPDGWMDQWLPEEGAANVVSIESPPTPLSKAESRLLAMWRTWTPEIKRYAFGQMLVVDYTKGVLAKTFALGERKRTTEKDVERFAIDTVSEAGRLKK